MRWTEIRTNSSKMFGENPDGIETLLHIFAHEPLNRTFERAFMRNLGNGAWRFHGNFQTMAHVFDVRSNDPDVIDQLRRAILTNREMPGFRSQPSAKRQMEAIRKWRSGTQV